MKLTWDILELWKRHALRRLNLRKQRPAYGMRKIGEQDYKAYLGCIERRYNRWADALAERDGVDRRSSNSSRSKQQ